MNVLKKMVEGMIFALALVLIVMAGPSLSADEISIAIIDSGARSYVDAGESFTSYPARQDPLGHGTEIARLIRQNNPSAKIYMLQVCEKTGGDFKPSRDAILKAIQWSVDRNIRIVNMSLVTKYDQEIENAITNAATSHGVLFIAAGGNKTLASHFATDSKGYVCKVSKDVKPAFPASSPYVISVGALNKNGEIAGYSGRHCDVYAQGKTRGQEGTSFACARVTAEVAQLLADSAQRTMDKNDILTHLQGSL
ncbi:MAG TPA: S8/S53 family peptidase [Candidatus Omnitrophota bacterium]|nr:S8/S53 family peptidase [Candidatus Omnitrophota bacterium]HPD85540.1 S8/S53 family peptidase [Candidatus Omnitrophota bacterium]HRZ04420.1 S8/S53 family peptidase [Candidatus Omnitrophota bacterium]